MLPTEKSQSSACSFVVALALITWFIHNFILDLDKHAGHYQNLHSLIFTHDSLPLYCLVGSLLLWSL